MRDSGYLPRPYRYRGDFLQRLTTSEEELDLLQNYINVVIDFEKEGKIVINESGMFSTTPKQTLQDIRKRCAELELEKTTALSVVAQSFEVGFTLKSASQDLNIASLLQNVLLTTAFGEPIETERLTKILEYFKELYIEPYAPYDKISLDAEQHDIKKTERTRKAFFALLEGGYLKQARRLHATRILQDYEFGDKLSDAISNASLENLISLELDGDALELDGPTSSTLSLFYNENRRSPVDPNFLRAITGKAFPNLMVLGLKNNNYELKENFFVTLQNLPNLRDLDISGNYLGEYSGNTDIDSGNPEGIDSGNTESIDVLTTLSGLRRLNLRNTRMRDIHLIMFSDKIKDESLLPNLVNLDLGKNYFNDGLSSFATAIREQALPELKELLLSENTGSSPTNVVEACGERGIDCEADEA